MAGFTKEHAEEILNIKIEDEVLFQTAFTHRSYLNEHPEYKNPSNERLEFLGDAVLQLLSSEYLFLHFPDEPEGQLTNYRSAIVNTKSLGQEAGRIGYGELLLLSKGEEASGGREREYILANTFEAALGALFLEKGIDFCRTFVEKQLLYKTEEIVGNKLYKDPKSSLQEAVQEKFGVTPVYKVLETIGPDHDKTFKVGLFVNDQPFGEGTGKSKQKGEQSAALKGLDKLKSL